MHKIRQIIFLLIGFCFFSIAYGDVQSSFEAGNKFYEEKKYDQAIAEYEKVLAENIESSTIYFNLGNSYFKKGDLGKAILNYHRAKRLEPSDDDIISNLEFAENFTSVQMEGVALNPISTFFDTLVAPYRLKIMAIISSVLFVLLVILLIVRFGLGYPSRIIKSVITVTLIFVFIASTFTTYKYRTDYLTRRAVIISDESPVHTGPSDQSEIELQGAPGLVVEIISESSNYYNVLFKNKRRGWIDKQFVAEI